MATIFKEVVNVNAPGQDVIFDGCDFTEQGYLYIEAASSVKIINCRFYSVSNSAIRVDGETKLMVSYSYFGKDSIISVDSELEDGSFISNNYFNGGDNNIIINGIKNEAAITISNNVFKGEAFIKTVLAGSPTVTIDVFNNQFEADYLMHIGCSTETDSYNNVTVKFTDNIGKKMVILNSHVLGEGVPNWCDTDNWPVVITNGVKVGYDIPMESPEEMIHNLMFQVFDSNGVTVGYYDSFSQAYSEAPNECEIKLLADGEIADETVTIATGHEVHLDLNDFTLTLNQAGPRCIFNDGNMIIFGGTIDQVNEDSYGCIDSSKHNAAGLTLQNVIVNDNGNGDGAAIVDRGGGTVVITNCEFNSTNSGKYGNACCTMNYGASVIIENCTFESATTVGGYPIICRGAELHVNNCNIHGAKGGVGIDYGKMYINGGTIVADNYYGCWVTNDGVSTECHITGNPSVTGKLYAVYCAVDDGNQDLGSSNVTIDSGTFVGNTKAAAAIGSKSTVRDWGMTITGGTFLMGDGTRSDVSAYVPTGYIQNEAGEVVKTLTE